MCRRAGSTFCHTVQTVCYETFFQSQLALKQLTLRIFWCKLGHVTADFGGFETPVAHRVGSHQSERAEVFAEEEVFSIPDPARSRRVIETVCFTDTVSSKPFGLGPYDRYRFIATVFTTVLEKLTRGARSNVSPRHPNPTPSIRYLNSSPKTTKL